MVYSLTQKCIELYTSKDQGFVKCFRIKKIFWVEEKPQNNNNFFKEDFFQWEK